MCYLLLQKIYDKCITIVNLRKTAQCCHKCKHWVGVTKMKEKSNCPQGLCFNLKKNQFDVNLRTYID